jgi:serine/threonine protein kinase
MFKHKYYIADGTYGKVYHVNYNNVDKCLKEYKTAIDNLGVTEDILKEIFHSSQIYSNISISYVSENFKYIIMDLFNGDLYDYKKMYYTNIDLHYKNISEQILKQLYTLHSHGFIHIDIKMANILFNKISSTFTLCDFGLCEYYGFPCIKKKYICTEYFRAPSLGINNNINYDIYSLGATLYYYAGNKFCEIIDNTKISNNVIKVLINYNHEISAKKILDINLFCEKKQKYLKKIVQKLHLKEENIINNNLKLNDNIFLNLTIKNNVYKSYQFNNENLFELDYLDDMFITYQQREFTFVNNINDNLINDKIKLLKLHKHINSHLDTLFFAWYLLDNVTYLNKLDSTDELSIFFNFSCKLLEFNNITKIELATYSIIEVEYYLISKFLKKELVFTPGMFYIYYFIYQIASQYSNQYYIEYRMLESIVLPIYILYLLRPFKCNKKNTYIKLAYRIVLIAIDFIFKKKINDKWYKILKMTTSFLDDDIKLLIIENNELRNYLSSTHKE